MAQNIEEIVGDRYAVAGTCRRNSVSIGTEKRRGIG